MWEQEIVVGSYMSIIIATLDCGSLTQWVEIMSNRVHRHFFFFFLFCCSGNVANSSSSSLIRDKPTTASKKKKEKKNYESKMSHQQCRALWGIIIIIIITQFIVRISDLQKFTNFFFFLFLGFSHNFFAGQRSRPSHPKLRNTATATTSTHWISFAHLLDSDCHKFLFISPPITAVITGRRGGWQFSTFYLLI